jgi:hypothetical protein
MSRRIIPNLIFKSDGWEEPDYSTLSTDETVRNIIYTNTFIGIKEAIKKRAKNAKIIEVNSSGHYITVVKEDFKTALDNTLIYHEELEDYETCAQIIKLKKQI